MNSSFVQWCAENSMSRAFQLAELNRQFGLLSVSDSGIVSFAGGVGAVADEIRGKKFVLETWDELYDGEILENNPNDWNEQNSYLPGDPDGLIEQSMELRDKELDEVE